MNLVQISRSLRDFLSSSVMSVKEEVTMALQSDRSIPFREPDDNQIAPPASGYHSAVTSEVMLLDDGEPAQMLFQVKLRAECGNSAGFLLTTPSIRHRLLSYSIPVLQFPRPA